VLDSELIPDLKAFQSLGFPLRQTAKVHLNSRQSNVTKSQKTNGGADGSQSNSKLPTYPKLSSNQSVTKMFGFNTLPLMESAVGAEQAQTMLEQVIAEEESGQDVGCICEIDLTRRKKISKIMSRLLYPPKQVKNNNNAS